MYLRVSARTCAHLRVFCCICAYLRVFVCICAYLCVYLRVFVRCSYVPVVLSSEAFISQRLSSADSVSLLAPPATLLCRELLQNQSADSFSASATFDSPLQVPSSDSFCRLSPAGSCRLSPAGSFVRFFLQILSSCLFASASSEKQARGRAIHLCRRFFLQIASGS